jgi:ribosomal protein S18 acetylase RimI-like enzyme
MYESMWSKARGTNIAKLHNNLSNFGAVDAFYDLSLRVINRIVFFKILQGLFIPVSNHYPAYDGNHRHLILDEHTLIEFSKYDEYELSERFIYQALEKGDECRGIIHDDRLATYVWYSTGPTSIDPEELVLHFSDEYIYMYKCFTHPDYRGRRLNAKVIKRALNDYLERGYKGIVAYVESNNFSSFKSLYRIGFKNFGKIVVTRIGGRYQIFTTESCREYGFRLEMPKPLFQDSVIIKPQADL